MKYATPTKGSEVISCFKDMIACCKLLDVGVIVPTKYES